jgi:hypothetical protein
VPLLRSVALALALALPAAPNAQPQPRQPRLPRLLVFDFRAQGDATKEVAATLADVAAREAARLGTFQVLTQADVVTQLNVEHQRKMMGCTEDRSCLAEIAGALDAERTLTGTVTRLGEAYLVSVTLVDARKAATLGGAEETLRGDATGLSDAVRRVTHRALTGKELDTDGVIDLDVADAGARVLLDGAEIGRGPVRRQLRASSGAHRVVVDLEGYATWESVIRLTPGATTAVGPRLVPLSRGGGPRQTYVGVEGVLAAPTEPPGGVGPGSGVGVGGRVGRRLGRSWAAEAAAAWLTTQRGDAQGEVDLAGLQGGLAAAWTPFGGWLWLAAEVGADRTNFTHARGGYPSESGAARSWYGGGEVRLDLPLGEALSFGLRLGARALSTKWDSDPQRFLPPIASEYKLKFATSYTAAYARAGFIFAF